jgi:hypothetical protein
LSADEIITNQYKWQTILSLCLLQASLAITLGIHNLWLQHKTLSQESRLAIFYVFICLLLASFYYLLNYIEDATQPSKNYSDQYAKRSHFKRQKIKNICAISGTIMTILMQTFFMAHLFVSFLVQLATPLCLSVSCLMFLFSSLLDESNVWIRTIKSVLFFIGAVAGTLLSLDALNTVPAFINHHFWKQHLLPNTILWSTIACSFLLLPLSANSKQKKEIRVMNNESEHNQLPPQINNDEEPGRFMTYE